MLKIKNMKLDNSIMKLLLQNHDNSLKCSYQYNEHTNKQYRKLIYVYDLEKYHNQKYHDTCSTKQCREV